MSRPWQRTRLGELQLPWGECLQLRPGHTWREADSCLVEDLYQAFKERLIAELRSKAVAFDNNPRVLLSLVEVELEVET